MRRNLTGHFWCLYLTHRHSFMFLFSFCFVDCLTSCCRFVFQSGFVFHVVIVASLLIRRTHWPLRGLKGALIVWRWYVKRKIHPETYCIPSYDLKINNPLWCEEELGATPALFTSWCCFHIEISYRIFFFLAGTNQVITLVQVWCKFLINHTNIRAQLLVYIISCRYPVHKIDHFPRFLYVSSWHVSLKQRLDMEHFHVFSVVGKNLGCIRPFN